MAFLGIIFALAACLWLAVILQRGGLLAGCVLVVLCGACLGHPFVHVSFATLDRLLWLLIVALYVGLRWRGGGDPKPLTTPDLILGSFLLVLTLSTFGHDWKIDGAQPVARLLFLYLMPAGLYWVGRQSAISNHSVRWLCGVFAALAVYLAVTAVAEIRGIRGLVFPSYIMSAAYPEFLGRGRGPFLNPSANGIYMATGLACLWMFWPAAQWPGRKLIASTGIAGGSALVLLGSFATLTRCVWLGVSLSSAMLVALPMRRRRSLGILLLVSCAGLLALGTGWKHLVAFKRDKNVSVNEMAQSAKLRPMLAAVAWQIFRDDPIDGVGFGQYKEFDRTYIAQRQLDLPLDQVRPYHQHNVFLGLLTETGLLGTVPFVALLISWTRVAVRQWRQSTASVWQRRPALIFLACLINYLANGMFQDVALIPMVNLLLFFWAGVLISTASASGAVVAATWPRTAGGLFRDLAGHRRATGMSS